MPDRKKLEGVEVGDRVWVANRYGKRIQTVQRLTRTQIIVDGHTTRFERGKPSKYSHPDSKPTYYQIGGGGFAVEWIDSIATKEECLTWDAEQEVKRQQQEAKRAESERQEALRRELYALFSIPVGISESYHVEGADWAVTLSLTTDGIRRLAELLKDESL